MVVLPKRYRHDEGVEMTEYPQDDSESELTWDEAVAAFRSGEPVELVRPNRKIVINYRYEGNRVHATSSDLTGFEVMASSLAETKRLVRDDLARYLESGVELVEREAGLVPTESASRSQIISGMVERITTTTTTGIRVLIASNGVRAA